MSLRSGSLLLLAAAFLVAPSKAATTTPYNCPPVNVSTVIVEATTGSQPITISIPSTTSTNELCTLIRRKTSTGKSRAPVARSYAGRNWEVSAGFFARSGSGLIVDCDTAASTTSAGVCDVTLPSLGDDQEYVLESFVHQVTPEVEAARFLEQATFGPTRETIDALVTSSNTFESWIHEQIYTIPPSSHREFLRRNTHPKFEYSWRTGAVGSRPCEKYSRWRKYAISSRDLMDDRKTARQKHLTVDIVSEGVTTTGYVWKVDGIFRTVTQEHPAFTDGSPIELGARYRIGELKRSFYANCVGCEIRLTHADGITEFYIANPPVSITGVEGNTDLLPYSTVNLPPYGSADFPAVEKAADKFPLFTDYLKEDENGMVTTDALESSSQCDGFPSFRQPEAVSTPSDDAPESTLPTVFGRSINPDTGLEEIFVFDPHLTLYENTIDKPLADGGGQLVIDTYDPLPPSTQVKCQNAYPTNDNKEGCQLSYLTTACAPDEVPTEVIVLDSANLEGIRALTGKSLYPVTGLSITEEAYTAEDGTPVNSVLDKDNTLSISGCNSVLRSWAAADGNTEKFWCDKTDLWDVSAEIIFSPPKAKLSIVHGMRLYTSNTATNADPASYVLEGRSKPDGPWELIGAGDLDMSITSRNGRGFSIESTYESADNNYAHWEVSFANNTKAYWDYKLSIPTMRNPTQSTLQFGEVELPGVILPAFPIDFKCAPGAARNSRWMKQVGEVVCPNTANLGEKTQKLFADLISGTKSSVYNPNVVDVTREYSECDVVDTYKLDLGLVKGDDGSCWKHVHDLEHSIVDLTPASPLDYSVSGGVAQVTNTFMSSIVNDPAYPIVGKHDDHSLVDGSQPPLSQQDVKDAFMTLEYNPSGQAVLICGSPGEVATDPFASDAAFDIGMPQNTGTRDRTIWELSSERHTTWTQLALSGDDQLRQIVAWGLSQILAIGLPGSGTVFYEVIEPYTMLYDYFQRNGFGSYRKLLEDMSFNLIMANWLTYLGNTSHQANINAGLSNLPDENYAREIMQLFSIGLYQLNMDGSQVLDDDGIPMETYTIDDIMSFAAVWTGFEQRKERGGASASNRHSGESSLDPMYINPETRDHFPKSNLFNGYIGDQVALCNELPERAFLRKGAVYKLLGSNPTPMFHSSDSNGVDQDPDRPKIELDPSSPLFVKLCSQSNGECTFPSEVVLEDNLFYDLAAESGVEYEVDTVRTVEMKDGLSHPIYYEYIRQPCVEHSFYNGGKKVIRGQIHGDAVQDNTMCADPSLSVATTMCLTPGSEQSIDGKVYCHYVGERMTYASAAAMCTSVGLELGEPYLFRGNPHDAGICAKGLGSQFNEFRSWTDAPCNVKVKVSFETGKVAIVHDPAPDHGGMKNVEPSVSESTLNFFKTPWVGGHPNLNDCLSIASCYVHEDESCICDTEVATNAVFSSSSEILSIDNLKTKLQIGAADPLSFVDGLYTDVGDCGIDGLTVYSTGGDCSSFDSDTIFSFELKSKRFFLKNFKSDVYISGSNFAFRNPVQFPSVVDPQARDMYHETAEVLDSLIYHPSHPPFLAMRLTQRFGLSNPSPGYIERVSRAYEAGTFVAAGGTSFGTGKYGDLAAMVAAILLDPEARAVVLDADQAHGQAIAPLDKVIKVFRAMKLQFESPLSMPTLLDLYDRIGQGSFESPSVFNFYLVEYAPPGVVQDAGIYAPETQVYQGYKITYYLDAMSTTSKFGINDCPKVPSFEGYRTGSGLQCTTIEGNTSVSPAHFSYWPSLTNTVSEVIDELSLLLTGGRLRDSSKALIASLVQPIVDGGDMARAVRAAQQYILTSPEAHTTGMARSSENERQITGYESKPRGPYKAVVFLMMAGGMDTYNLLVPKCADAYAEYTAARGAHALPLQNLKSIYTTGQQCSEFGVHSDFPLLADMYNETVFFANLGTLSKPLTKHDKWNKESNMQLFAHNAMSHELYRGDPYGKAEATGVFGRILDMLQKQGHHTSANNVYGDKDMLIGFPENQNPVSEVTLGSPAVLNKYPTVENLFDVAKQLNGVGEAGNSFFSEAWAEAMSTALFEHDQQMAIAEAGIEVTDYPYNSDSKLSKSLNAVANYILTRDFRNVNRDMFVVRENGFDMHGGDDLALAFQDINAELGKFINEMKRQGIWNDVAIVMGSEFGRSITSNSNAGTDHGWAGDYFLIGGGVNGGKVLGNYPSPLSPSSDYWVGHGRMIPTTPWESVWNGIAQWLGVRDEADLDRALPNRKSFSECDHFSDKDLFVDGACDCTLVDGTCSCQCEVTTYSPTTSPTLSPSVHPSTVPTVHPSSLPSLLPSASPTIHPTNSPSADLPDVGALVSSVIDTDGTYLPFGCSTSSRNWASIDGTLEKFHCDRTGFEDVSAGLIFSPPYVQASIARKVRVYAGDAGTSIDPIHVTLEGRINPSADWEVIGAGDLEYSNDNARNPRSTGLQIESTFESGDTNYTFAEVGFPFNNKIFSDYKVSFSTRSATATRMQFAELEFPGLLMPPPPTPPPTLSPSVSPTKAPSGSPTLHPTPHPTASLDLGANAQTTNSIVYPGSLESFGCPARTVRWWAALEPSTEKFMCDRDLVPAGEKISGFILRPDQGGKLTIAKELRLYTHNNCPNCDCVEYILEGRTDAASAWVEIGAGDLPWAAQAIGRNARGLPVESTFESGDNNLQYTSVPFPSHSTAYLEYKFTCLMTRNDNRYWQLGRIEIPGYILG